MGEFNQTLMSKTLENLDQLIDCMIAGTQVEKPRNDVNAKVSIVAIAEEASRACNGPERSHGTAYVIFRKAWAEAYDEYKPNPKRGYEPPPPMKRG